jgi:prepilin-type N-terminal cleavage/methylation domain-containing protein
VPVSSAPRRGFTLVELLVALSLASVVAAALLAVLVRQQRFYAGVAQLVETRAHIREGLGVLPGDLRNISTAAGDLLATSDSAVELRATIGSAVACDAGSHTLDLPPLDAATMTLTAWLSHPQAGDEMHVLDDRTGEFRSFSVASVESSAALCPGSPLVHPSADAGKPRHRITVDASLPPGVGAGSPMRFTRRVRYSLYRSPSDGRWYLGHTELNPSTGTFNAVQPVSGPYRARAGVGASGIEFRFLDGSGNVAPTGGRVVAIDVVVRGVTRGVVRIDGFRTNSGPRQAEAESVTVAVRNRP